MNERIDDLITLAALGELTADEARELDAAVQADPAVARELDDALAAAAALQSAAPVSPPPTLRASVLDAIAGLPQGAAGAPPVLGGAAAPGEDESASVSASPTAGADAVAAPDTTGPAEAPSVVRSIGSARSRRRIGPWIAAAAAAVVVVVGAVVVLSGDGDDPGVADEIAAVIDADDAVARSLSGDIGAIEVVFSAERDALVLTGDGIEPLPEGSTYQAWLVADGAPASVGTFAPDAEGTIALRADGVDPTGAVVAVTVEPAGGSEQPTMPIVAQTA